MSERTQTTTVAAADAPDDEAPRIVTRTGPGKFFATPARCSRERSC